MGGRKMAVAPPGKGSLGPRQVGVGGSLRAVRSAEARPHFVEGSIVRIFMENFL